MIKRYLEPEDVAAEVLFGLIMALTFTLGATLATASGPERYMEIVRGTVTCNIAWGVIDGTLYLLTEVFTLGRTGLRISRVKRARSDAEAIERIRATFHDRFSPITTHEERERIYAEIRRLVLRMDAPPPRPTRGSVAGAVIVFLLVSATSLPVLLPAILAPDRAIALEISNGLLIVGLFATGYAMARIVERPAIRVGLAMAAIGLVLVAVAKALGG
ncbi:MAG TPA: VIT1/CCC1 transporter family protein [Stellaceae bacterium]|nr:VIT1/CCC1 transporter family protein [Stellaceae bacterium]